MEAKLKEVKFGGLVLQVPEIWVVETENYEEPDGRTCASIDVSALPGDVRSFVLSYGPMPEGSDALMEAAGTFEEIIDGDASDEIDHYQFQDYPAYGFDFESEDGQLCNFMCLAVDAGEESRLLTILTSAANENDLSDLLDFLVEYVDFE